MTLLLLKIRKFDFSQFFV